MADASVGVRQATSPDRQIDNETVTTTVGEVYRQRVRNYDSAEVEYSHAVGPEASPGNLVTASGDTTIKTPTSGKKLRVHWLAIVNDPAATSPAYVKVRFGSNNPFYGVYALTKRQLVTGGTNEALIVNLSAGGSVAVDVIYEEIT